MAEQQRFLADELRPRLDAAQAGQGHVFFVDAAHFVFGTFLCCLWSFGRLFVRAASGRQRFNVLGAWNAVTRELIAVTNTTVVNTETMCELLREVAARKLTGPITFVLDNARYQRNATVQALATQLGITLLFLPSYSPNLNLIERLWKFIKRKELYGKYHARFDNFRTAIQTCLSQVSTVHRDPLKSLMTLNFQTFENVSQHAAPRQWWGVLAHRLGAGFVEIGIGRGLDRGQRRGLRLVHQARYSAVVENTVGSSEAAVSDEWASANPSGRAGVSQPIAVSSAPWRRSGVPVATRYGSPPARSERAIRRRQGPRHRPA